jgi:hypothetical protein
MKAAFFALLSAFLLPLVALRAQTPSPYVETSTLTFYWSFTHSYITNESTPIPALPDVATFDPSTLPSGFETYTDTSTVRPYTGPVVNHFAPAGNNRQLINFLLQRMVRTNRLDKQVLGYRWQLIAVREAPANVREMATNPYRVFLSGQAGNSFSAGNLEVPAYGPEAITDDDLTYWYDDSTPLTPVVTVDTGITITLGQYNGSYTEKNWSATNDRVRNASGNVATAFRVDFGALFYDDPRHNFEPNNVRRDPTYNFHLQRNYWQATASGLINYGIRSVAGPLPTFVATNANATATGWFYHERSHFSAVNNGYRLEDGVTQTYFAAGTAPLKVTLSTIQYQKRGLFLLNAPADPEFASTETLTNESVQISWSHFGSNETGFIIERRVEGVEEWEEIARAEANETDFIDTELLVDTVYYYRVAAFNGAGVSEFTEEVSASTIAAPTTLDVGATSPTTIVMTWRHASDLETAFELQRRGPDGNWVVVTLEIAPNTLTYTDPDRAPDTLYAYRIRAIHAEFGASAWSNIEDATTPKPAENN